VTPCAWVIVGAKISAASRKIGIVAQRLIVVKGVISRVGVSDGD
jgi:hypothetical protein